MPTTISSTIGTGGDYSTLQSWENDCPANLVTADQIWEGKLKNQEFTNTSTPLTIAGQTTDATRYIILTTDIGASFSDNVNKLTNPLKYNASNGAAIRQSAGYGGPAMSVSTAYTRVSKIQLSAPSGLDSGSTISGSNFRMDDCISSGRHNGCVYTGASGIFRNCLFISTASPRNDSGGITNTFSGNVTAYNCTSVTYAASPAPLSAAFRNDYGTLLLYNCAGFGFSHFVKNQSLSGSSTHNASDKTILAGSNNQASLIYADQFENITSGSHDYRVKIGATLTSNGTDLSGSGVTTDIVGTSRSVPYTIGAWQVVTSSGPSRRRYYLV